MKTIKKDELFRSLNGFLKTKGVELKDGGYTLRINRACNLLTDAINSTQKTVKHARVRMDKKLDELRQTIHEATAPKAPPISPAPEKPVGGKRKTTMRTKPKASATSRKASRRK